MVGLDERGVDGIRSINEHWDGGGIPEGIAGEAIPLLARIMGIAQAVEVELTRGGARARARGHAVARGDVVRPVARGGPRPGRERSPASGRAWTARATCTPRSRRSSRATGSSSPTTTRLDRVAEAFARVIDAKSPYTARHSDGVARFAVLIAERMGFDAREVRDLRRAGLLHDIGKLGVSSRILDKPGKLDEDEWKQMRRHPELTARILGQVEQLRDLAAMAAAHHERLDGRGYHLGLTAEQLSPSARVLAVADVAEALSADRPYRAGLAPDVVLDIIGRTQARRSTPTRSSRCARPGRPRRCSYSRRPSSRAARGALAVGVEPVALVERERGGVVLEAVQLDATRAPVAGALEGEADERVAQPAAAGVGADEEVLDPRVGRAPSTRSSGSAAAGPPRRPVAREQELAVGLGDDPLDRAEHDASRAARADPRWSRNCAMRAATARASSGPATQAALMPDR